MVQSIYMVLQSGLQKKLSVFQSGGLFYSVKPYVDAFPYGYYDVHPGLGLNHMQDWGVEEKRNGLDKPIV